MSAEPLKTDSLCKMLDEACELLVRVGETHWAKWLSDCSKKIRNNEQDGWSHLIRAYGGMGSFSGLVILPENEHNVMSGDSKDVNTSLDALRSSIYALALETRPSAYK